MDASEQKMAGNEGVVSTPLFDIPDYRIRAFVRGVADRLRAALAAGETEAVVYEAIARERHALERALDYEPVRAAFAESYAAHYNTLSPTTPIDFASARQLTDDVLDNRRNDARALAALAGAPTFRANVRAALNHLPAATEPYALPPEKIEEMVARFSQDESRYGSEPKIHAQQAMDGHRLGHLALAQCFASDGALQSALQTALAEQLPEASPAARAQLSVEWVDARRKPAQATADALAPASPLRQAVDARIAQAHQTTRGMNRVTSFAERVLAEPTISFVKGA